MTEDPPKPRRGRGAPRKAELCREQIAKKYGVSTTTLRNWEHRDGIDVLDEAAVMAKVAAMKHKPAGGSEDERAAKLRKTKAEADMIEHKLAVQRGEFVSAEETRNEGLRIGGLVKEVFLKAPDELAPLLAGRPAHEVKSALKKWASDKLTELAGYQSPVKIEPENQ